MSVWKVKQEWMQKTVVVWFGALLCCLLWGSAFPCIKIGYKMFHIASADASSQLLFAGCRFFLAGVLVLLLGTSGYGIADPFCRLQIYTGRSSGSWDWECNGGVFFTAGEKSSKRNYLVKPASDDHSIFLLLYGTCTYQWSKSFYYRSGECIYCDSGSRIFVSSGKDYIKKNHWLYSGICRSSID